MKKFLTSNFVIALLTVIILWGNFSRNYEVLYDEWSSLNNINGYQFEETPEYFKYLEKRKITLFALQEILILVSGLFLMQGLKKNE